jgi:micrococcal nuclease
MAQDLIPDTDYQKLFAAVAREIESGTQRIAQAYRAEVVRTTWNIGRVITESITFQEAGSFGNGVVVAKLAQKFHRPETYFYNVIKFYRVYPTLPQTKLSWSHYEFLIRVDDAAQRRRLEQKVLREKMSAKDLRAYIPELGKASELIPTTTDDKIPYQRGELYHYRTLEPTPEEVKNNRILVDVGFSVERDVRASKAKSLRAGRIVRAVKNGEDYSVRISLYRPERLYTYTAFVKRVIDADTLIVRVDLGFRTHVTYRVRLRGIDAPEVNSVLGRKAKLFVQSLVDRNPWIVIKTYQLEKYGRCLVDVFVGPKEQDSPTIAKEGEYLNQLLLDKGLAVRMD